MGCLSGNRRPSPALAKAEFHVVAAAAIIVLLVMLLTLNATAIVVRNHFQKRRN